MRRSFALLLSALALGCGDDGETETQPEPEPEPEPPATVSYATCMKYGVTGAPASGVTWAVLDRPELPTAVTGSDGCVVLAGLPPNEELLLSWTKDGDFPRLRPVRTGTSDFENPEVEYQLPNSEVQLILDWAYPGQDIDPMLGLFTVFVTDADSFFENDVWLEDIDVAMTPPEGVACPLPVDWITHYLDSEGCGTAAQNIGVVSHHALSAGVKSVTVGPDDVSCREALTEDGWQLAWTEEGDPERLRVPVRLGFETFVTVSCRR